MTYDSKWNRGAFDDGVRARIDGRPLADCPRLDICSTGYVDGWRAGWLDVDYYPEHEKLKAHEKEAAVLTGFLDFLTESRLEIARFTDKGQLVVHDVPNKERIIGLYLGIDPEKLGVEKQAMYQKLRLAARP